ncbi:3-oxoacyl-[acyl-carrier-protein] reductase FabG [Campylobacterota bacterium]|nr:3-oxoacyl-[acyl-carrier-protein] reductase FabG [Campylobacterota bacterium]
MNILITGGSGGLGRAMIELAAAEHTVYFTHNKSSCAWAENHSNITAIKADFTVLSDVEKLIAAMDKMDLDVLINNAYIGKPLGTHFHKTAAAEFMDSFAHNIMPTITITQKAIAIFMAKRFGKIINVLSTAVANPPTGFSRYACDKAYLAELTLVWAKEYARYNITANAIAPEYMDTGFSNIDERFLEQAAERHPLKRILTPQETAEAVMFLVAATQQISGITIPIGHP